MSITHYFLFIAFSSLWCLGIFAITRKGKIFDFVDNFYAKILDAKRIQQKIDKDERLTFSEHLRSKLYDPISGCCTCMASVHTLYLYLFYCDQTGNDFTFWIWCAIAIPVAFLNELLWNVRTSFVNFGKIVGMEIEKEKKGGC